MPKVIKDSLMVILTKQEAYQILLDWVEESYGRYMTGEFISPLRHLKDDGLFITFMRDSECRNEYLDGSPKPAGHVAS